MKRFILFATLCLALSCTNEEDSYRALVGAGYSNIEFHGHAYFKCGRDDGSCTAFTALGPTGVQVEGAVGCGHGCGKSCTVRLD